MEPHILHLQGKKTATDVIDSVLARKYAGIGLCTVIECENLAMATLNLSFLNDHPNIKTMIIKAGSGMPKLSDVTHIESLEIDNNQNKRELGELVRKSTKLKRLKFDRYNHEIPTDLGTVTHLTLIGCEHTTIKKRWGHLIELRVRSPVGMWELLGVEPGTQLPKLESLHLEGLHVFDDDLSRLTQPSNLHTLVLDGCSVYTHIPKNLPKLKTLKVSNQTRLSGASETFLDPGESYIQTLQILHLSKVDGFTTLPTLPNLQSLSVEWCKSFASCPTLPNGLEELRINSAKSLRSLPHTELRRLSFLYVDDVHPDLNSFQKLPISTLNHGIERFRMRGSNRVDILTMEQYHSHVGMYLLDKAIPKMPETATTMISEYMNLNPHHVLGWYVTRM